MTAPADAVLLETIPDRITEPKPGKHTHPLQGKLSLEPTTTPAGAVCVTIVPRMYDSPSDPLPPPWPQATARSLYAVRAVHSLSLQRVESNRSGAEQKNISSRAQHASAA